MQLGNSVVVDLVNIELIKWRDRKYITLKEFEENIEHSIDRYVKSGHTKCLILSVVNKWLLDVAKDLEVGSEAIGKEFGVSERLHIQEILGVKKGMNQFRYDFDGRELGKISDLDEIVGLIVKTVVLTLGHVINIIVNFCIALSLIYITVVLLSSTGYGLFLAVPLSLVAVKLAWEMAKGGARWANILAKYTGSAVVRDPREKNYSERKRKEIYEKIQVNFPTMKTQVINEVKSSIIKDRRLKDEIISEAQNALELAIDNAINMARLMID